MQAMPSGNIILICHPCDNKNNNPQMARWITDNQVSLLVVTPCAGGIPSVYGRGTPCEQTDKLKT